MSNIIYVCDLLDGGIWAAVKAYYNEEDAISWELEDSENRLVYPVELE